MDVRGTREGAHIPGQDFVTHLDGDAYRAGYGDRENATDIVDLFELCEKADGLLTMGNGIMDVGHAENDGDTDENEGGAEDPSPVGVDGENGAEDGTQGETDGGGEVQETEPQISRVCGGEIKNDDDGDGLSACSTDPLQDACADERVHGLVKGE